MLDSKYHLLSMLAVQVQTRGDQLALQGVDSKGDYAHVSWAELEQLTAQIAKSLIAFGLQPQENVVILSDNMPQWTLADIATLKANGVVVPIYPTSTNEQIEYIINDCQAKVVFVDSAVQYERVAALIEGCPSVAHLVVFSEQVALQQQATHHHLSLLINQSYSDEVETALTERLAIRRLDDLFTLIYTSGTTGNPKGVMLDYRNMGSSIAQHDNILPFKAGDTSLAFLPLSHVFERGWSYYVLSRGGTNVYLSDTARVKEALAEVKPHTMCVVPRFLEKIHAAVLANVASQSLIKRSIFNWSLKQGFAHSQRVQRGQASGVVSSFAFTIAKKLVLDKIKQLLGGRLKFMPTGGAALDLNVAQFFQSLNIPVLVGYGMTETTATITCNTLSDRVAGTNGKPLPNIAIKIGDNSEILVKGDTVMRGYYNLPEATAETFTQDGWLKTGDAGCFDEAGNLLITDRIKELMKTSNGKYIAPQRVEGKVSQHNIVEQIAIIADAKNYVTALIVPAMQVVEEWAKARGIQYSNYRDLLLDNRCVSYIEQCINSVQDELAGYEKIKKFTLLAEEFTMQGDLITPTMKLKRKKIYQKYAKEIELMY